MLVRGCEVLPGVDVDDRDADLRVFEDPVVRDGVDRGFELGDARVGSGARRGLGRRVTRDEERRDDAELKKPAHRLPVTMSLAVVLLCAACAACNEASPRERPIEMLVQNDAETLDPRYVTDAVGIRTSRLIHAGLTRLDSTTLAPTPYAAKSWAWIDPQTLR